MSRATRQSPEQGFDKARVAIGGHFPNQRIQAVVFLAKARNIRHGRLKLHVQSPLLLHNGLGRAAHHAVAPRGGDGRCAMGICELASKVLRRYIPMRRSFRTTPIG